MSLFALADEFTFMTAKLTVARSEYIHMRNLLDQSRSKELRLRGELEKMKRQRDYLTESIEEIRKVVDQCATHRAVVEAIDLIVNRGGRLSHNGNGDA